MPVPEPLRRAAWLLPVLVLTAGCGGPDPGRATPDSPSPSTPAGAPVVPSSAPSPGASPEAEPSGPASDRGSAGPSAGSVPAPTAAARAASPSAGPVPAPVAAARAAPACRTDQLQLSVQTPADDVLLLLLTNASSAPCSVQGHPAVSLLDDSRQQIRDPAAEHADSAPAVVLDPAAVGNVLLTAESLTCEVAQSSSYVRLVPPAQTEPLVAPAELAACATMVSAVYPGRVSPLRTS